MSRLDELIRKLCPNGVEHKRIGDFAMCFPGATPKTTHPEYWENGTIPWMSSGEVNQEEVTFTEKKITQKAMTLQAPRWCQRTLSLLHWQAKGKHEAVLQLLEFHYVQINLYVRLLQMKRF